MGTVGIQKALVKNVNVKTTKNYGGNVLVELIEDNASLEAYVDETCLGANTQKPKKTLENVRWLLIRQHVWTNYRSLYPTMGKQEFFDTLINSLDSKDYKLFNGNEVKITKEYILSQSPIGNLGAIYMLMPYNNFPEYEIGNVYIVALGKPQILYTQFKFPKNGYIPLEHHDRRATYGQTVNVEVYTHLLPDCRSQGKQFDFEVELFNESGEVLSKSGLESLKCDGEYSYNNRHKLSFLIDIDWQKKHVDKEKDEKFYLRIKGRERFSQPSIYDPDRVVFNEDEYNSKEDSSNWMRFERGKWVYDSSGVLLVPFDTFAEMMGRFETQKNNTIQYIGDIKYTKREFDPCGYKRIKVKSGDREVYLFDEDKTNISSIDHTSWYFDIIAGDSPKEVVITAEGLQHAPNHLCTGVLLPAGQKHDSWEKVFQMGHVQPAEKGERGYKTRADDTDRNHPDDRDVYASTSKGVSVHVADVQMLTLGEDYFKASDNAIELKLGYRYNKTFLEPYTSGLSKSVADNLWLFRYFWLSEKLAQTYFVPISTCRYPNQLAKIRVFPNVEWEVAFLINTSESHTLQVGKHKEDVSTLPQQNNLKLARGRLVASSNYKGLNFGIDFKVKENNNIHSLSFDKIQNIIKKLADLKSFFDQFNPKNSQKATKKGFVEYFSFTIISPNIALVLRWYFGMEKNQAICFLNGEAKLLPLLGIELNVDLFIITDNIPSWGIGRITKVIRKTIEWVSDSDIYCYLYAKVELGGTVAIKYNSKNGFDDKMERKAEWNIPFGIKGGIKSNEDNVIILPSGEKVDKFKGEISVNSGVKITEELGVDIDKGVFKETICNFSGLSVSIVVVEHIFMRQKLALSPKVNETILICNPSTIGEPCKVFFDEK